MRVGVMAGIRLVLVSLLVLVWEEVALVVRAPVGEGQLMEEGAYWGVPLEGTKGRLVPPSLSLPMRLLSKVSEKARGSSVFT